MGYFTLGYGHNKLCLRFYVLSPARIDVELPNGCISFSRETPPGDKDWDFLSDEGRQMVMSLWELQGGRNEYVLVTADYVDFTLYSEAHGLAIFARIAEVLNQWTGGGPLRIYLAADCSEDEKWSLGQLINTLA